MNRLQQPYSLSTSSRTQTEQNVHVSPSQRISSIWVFRDNVPSTEVLPSAAPLSSGSTFTFRPQYPVIHYKQAPPAHQTNPSRSPPGFEDLILSRARRPTPPPATFDYDMRWEGAIERSSPLYLADSVIKTRLEERRSKPKARVARHFCTDCNKFFTRSVHPGQIKYKT